VLDRHGIDPTLVAETYDEWARFFADPGKHAYAFDPERFDGYYPFGTENAKTHEDKDLKEFFHLYSWSPLPHGFSSRTRELFSRLEAVGATLLSWLDANTPSEVRRAFAMPLASLVEGSRQTLLRIIHYPPIGDDANPHAFRAYAHEDINLLTLLPAGTAPGLELRDATGNWHAVPSDPTSLIVNAGDMLEMASGGYFRSTTHRVVNPSGHLRSRSRYAMPLFLHPRSDVRLSATHTAGEYLDERLAEIGLK
jgi:isopenicillin N synthase-like dioxygenase